MTQLALLGPDPARRLLDRELDGSEYDAAHATWWDRLSEGLLRWLGGLRLDGIGGDSVGWTVLVIGIVVLVAVVVLVVVSRGLPRRRTSVGGGGDGVFDPDDARSADALRASARGAVRAGDWRLAVLEGYRAMARGLGERDLVPDVPGQTARTIARAARPSFPALGDQLDAAAQVFDAARYLGHDADRHDAEQVLATDAAIAAARPVTLGPAVPA